MLNDINPGAVDEITQSHLRNLRDIIKSYLNISVKRERLQFIHNQEKAAAMRSAVPNPLAILSVSNALNWKKLALTVVYTAVDSYNNYKRVGENADMAFIMSGWELDDEEKDTVMKNRDRAFDYMVDMVQEYNLDGLKTLNEKAIEKFAEITGIANPSERIKLLKAEEQTYSMLGNYWLELANAYFETDQYKKCLECVDEYNDLATGIYRKDFIYVQILPKAIVAAQEIYSGEQYIATTSGFADAIISNTTTDDWSVRYFAAQVYLDLYAKTNDVAYLNKAYKIASEKVAKEKGYTNLVHFFDDGISGVTMDRPGFADMIQQLEQGKAAAVFVKDLSRLGRNYIEVGRLTEEFFPNHDIRLVAVSDNIDTDEGENELAPIRNLFNEWYARDISKKRRISNKIKGNAGEPMGQPPYGYIKDPENPKRWIVDEEAAQVVRRIYRMTLEGVGTEQIAAKLEEDGVLTPRAYWHSKGINRPGKVKDLPPTHWNSSSVIKMLSVQEYCGDINERWICRRNRRKK